MAVYNALGNVAGKVAGRLGNKENQFDYSLISVL